MTYLFEKFGHSLKFSNSIRKLNSKTFTNARHIEWTNHTALEMSTNWDSLLMCNAITKWPKIHFNEICIAYRICFCLMVHWLLCYTVSLLSNTVSSIEFSNFHSMRFTLVMEKGFVNGKIAFSITKKMSLNLVRAK